MLIDIVLLPSRKLSSKIGRLGLDVSKKFKMKKVVDGKKFLPHISLLHMRVKQASLAVITRTVLSFSRQHRKILISNPKPIAYLRAYGLSLKRTRPLYSLHENMVRNISKFRTGVTDLWPVGKKTAISWKYIGLYGSALVLENYSPHFTLGFPKSMQAAAKIKSYIKDKAPFQQFYASRLAVAQTDKDYQVVKIIREFRLK